VIASEQAPVEAVRGRALRRVRLRDPRALRQSGAARRYIQSAVQGIPVRVAKQESRQFRRFIALATAGLVAYSIALPLIRVYSIAADPTEPGRTIYAVVALLLYLPIQVWLVVCAARDAHGRGQTAGIVAMAAVIFGVMPVVGVGWVGILYVLAGLTLVSFRPPWSFVLFGAFVAAPTPLTFAFGHPEWALYFTAGMLFIAVPLAAGIWLIRVARQLQDARLALAEQAVARERLRIDAELRQTVGAGLERIAAKGDQVRDLILVDPARAASELRALVGAARRLLGHARDVLRQYREISPRAELETAATLLLAAGIRTTLQLPPGRLPGALDEGSRAQLRRDIARILGQTGLHSVTISAIPGDDGTGLRLVTVIDPLKTEVPVG
jgi:two-component system sensor histidine kinase DesK